MTAYSANARQSSAGFRALKLALLLLVAVGGTLALLVAGGMLDLPFLHLEPSRAGMVRVPMSGRLIPAYTKLMREDLWNTETNYWNEQWVPESSVRAGGAIADRTKVLGRVLDHDKPAGYAFTEDDFLPPGTRPGVVAGVPPGKRSLTVEVGKVQGLHMLRPGDHFDLLAAQKLEDGRLPAGSRRIVSGAGGGAGETKQAAVRVLVRDGVVVTPPRTRTENTTSQSLIGGTTTRGKPVEEMVVAIEPGEMAPLAEAMAVGASLTAMAHSGHPEDRPFIGQLDPVEEPPTVIEAVIGGKRDVLVFPAPPGS